MGKVAIVIGATGLVGRAVVDHLTQLDSIERIIALTRHAFDYDSEKVKNHVIDFDLLEDYAIYFQGDMLFSCLGTTLKQAGSIQAQYKVDVDYQLRAAKLAAQQGIPHYLLVSSSGASACSRSAYLSMKGELEEAIQLLPFSRISVFQPSLLLGKRSEYRVVESLASYFLPIITMVPRIRRYRPIQATEVAAKMVLVSQSSGKALEFFKLDDIFVN